MALSRRGRLARHALFPLALTLIAAFSLASPAAADPPGIQKVGVTSIATSSNKTLTASCPPGKVVTGGGGYLTAPGGPHQGRVALDRLEPLNSGGGFTAAMREVTTDPNAWRLTTDAICVPEPPGWDVVSSTAPLNTQSWSVSCGTKKVIGVGGRINNGNGRVILDRVQPSRDFKTVFVRATVVDGTAATNWSVTAFAVCANVNGLVHADSFIPPSSAAHKAISVSCPAGTALYSPGAFISPGSGEVFLTGVHAISTHLYSVWADEDISGYNLNTTVFAYGICGS